MIHIHWSTLIYIVVISIMAIKVYTSEEAVSILWIIGILFFTVVWGGVFWW